MLLQAKQPTKTPLKIWARSNGRIKSYGPFQPVHWSRQWYDPNGLHQHGVGIPYYSKENSLRKLLKKFGRDPTVGSKVIDLLSRYSGRLVGTPKRMSSACSGDSMLLNGKQPTETPLKIWAPSNGRIKSYGSFQPVLWSRRWYAPTDVIGVQ
jgi:hypothetical protein